MRRWRRFWRGCRVDRDGRPATLLGSRDARIALLALVGIVCHAVLWSGGFTAVPAAAPLVAVLIAGGLPLFVGLAGRALRGQFGADHLAGISIVASVLLDEYLAGAIVVLMLSGGDALEQFAVREATVGAARAGRVASPTLAHRRRGGQLEDVPVGEIQRRRRDRVFPHEDLPGRRRGRPGARHDGRVVPDRRAVPDREGAWRRGAVGGDQRRCAADDPRGPARRRFPLRADHAGHARRPSSGARPCGASAISSAPGTRRWPSRSPGWPGTRAAIPVRFLSVVVVATPCPLLIAIPVAIIGAISTAARRGVIVKDPAALEQLTLCRTMILDKTGTLTYGRPALSDEIYARAVHPRRGAAGRRRDRAVQPPSAGRAPSSRPRRMRATACRTSSGSARSQVSGLRARVDELNLGSTSRAQAGRPFRPAAGRADRPGMHRRRR